MMSRFKAYMSLLSRLDAREHKTLRDYHRTQSSLWVHLQVQLPTDWDWEL